MHLGSIVLGFFIGGFVGLLFMSIVQAKRDTDDRETEMKDLLDNMRSATEEERKSVEMYIKSNSKGTGFNLYEEMLKEEEDV